MLTEGDRLRVDVEEIIRRCERRIAYSRPLRHTTAEDRTP